MSNAPIKKFNSGKVTASVWERDYQGKPSYSYSFQKSYKDKQGQWQNVDKFYAADLKDVLALCQCIVQGSIKQKDNKPNFNQTVNKMKDQIDEAGALGDPEVPF